MRLIRFELIQDTKLSSLLQYHPNKLFLIHCFKVMLSLSLMNTFLCGIDAPDYDIPSKDDFGKRRWKEMATWVLHKISGDVFNDWEWSRIFGSAGSWAEECYRFKWLFCVKQTGDKTYVHHSSRVKYVTLIEIIAMFR